MYGYQTLSEINFQSTLKDFKYETLREPNFVFHLGKQYFHMLMYFSASKVQLGLIHDGLVADDLISTDE
jgi:hypothetical protein